MNLYVSWVSCMLLFVGLVGEFFFLLKKVFVFEGLGVLFVDCGVVLGVVSLVLEGGLFFGSVLKLCIYEMFSLSLRLCLLMENGGFVVKFDFLVFVFFGVVVLGLGGLLSGGGVFLFGVVMVGIVVGVLGCFVKNWVN